MDEYEATFVIDSKTDAFAVDRLMGGLYDSLREETRAVREESSDAAAMLEPFEAIRDAARRRRPGRLTVVYELVDEPFDP